jgi:DNA-binding NtrC family response regulator
MPSGNNLIDGLIGNGPAMQEVYRITRKAAPSNATVLLTGETGTGKELIARALHELSPRATGPFVRVNCGALSESLLESELFGHIKGAFTSAHESRTGRFEAAHGGTVFLDEINSVSYQLQVKLLRVLQEHEFERVGDTKTIHVDCRVIAATNVDLIDEIDAGRFRDDLYYRLNVIPIDLPPLRERAEDVPLLVDFFVERYSTETQTDARQFSPGAMQLLAQYRWPGNVRELQNYVERAMVLANAATIDVDDLPEHVRGIPVVRTARVNVDSIESLCADLVGRTVSEAGPDSTELYSAAVSRVEREVILQVLRQCQGVQTRTAARLGINRNTLHKKIDEHNLHDESR